MTTEAMKKCFDSSGDSSDDFVNFGDLDHERAWINLSLLHCQLIAMNGVFFMEKGAEHTRKAMQAFSQVGNLASVTNFLAPFPRMHFFNVLHSSELALTASPDTITKFAESANFRALFPPGTKRSSSFQQTIRIRSPRTCFEIAYVYSFNKKSCPKWLPKATYDSLDERSRNNGPWPSYDDDVITKIEEGADIVVLFSSSGENDEDDEEQQPVWLSAVVTKKYSQDATFQRFIPTIDFKFTDEAIENKEFEKKYGANPDRGMFERPLALTGMVHLVHGSRRHYFGPDRYLTKDTNAIQDGAFNGQHSNVYLKDVPTYRHSGPCATTTVCLSVDLIAAMLQMEYHVLEGLKMRESAAATTSFFEKFHDRRLSRLQLTWTIGDVGDSRSEHLQYGSTNSDYQFDRGVREAWDKMQPGYVVKTSDY